MSRWIAQPGPGRWARWAWAMVAAAVMLPCAAQPSAPLGPVDRAYFGLGVTGNDGLTPWPTVPFGSLRLWDAHVTWPHLEPQRGQWRFDTLDKYVATATGKGMNVLLVLGHSPAWASARPEESNAYKPGYAAEPASMADWETYVRTVATRYRGQIKEYQVWNEASDKTHYTGSVAKLVEMTCRAARVLKQVDPGIKLVSAGSAGGGRHVKYLDDFLAAGGAACIDVVAHHFYVPRLGPEAMVPLIRQVRAVMHKHGVDKLPLWCTEVGWWIAHIDEQSDHPIVAKGGWRKLDSGSELSATISRAFLLARAEGVSRLYWYAWNNNYGWSLSDSRRQMKPGAAGWTQVFNSVLGAGVGPCLAEAGRIACEVKLSNGAGKVFGWPVADGLTAREGPTSASTPSDALPKLD